MRIRFSSSAPRRRRATLPPWVAPAVILVVLVPLAMSQQTQPAAPATLPAPLPTTAPAAAAPRPPERTLLDWYWAGGAFMHAIALCSVLGLAIALERLIALRTGANAPRAFLPGLRQTMRDLNAPADREAGLAYCRGQGHALARVVAAGISRSPRGIEAIEKAMEDQGATELLRLRRNMRILYAIASVATLLGLIGTIQGMIFAFQEAEAVGTGKFAPLARGIYTALVTTFAGCSSRSGDSGVLLLLGRIEKIVSRLNDEGAAFLEEYGSLVHEPAPRGRTARESDAG
jgi:biopolymer transport protein ExbB